MAGKCESKSPAFPQIPARPAQLTRLRIFLSEQKFDFVKWILSCLLVCVFLNCLAQFYSFGLNYSISLKFNRHDVRAKIVNWDEDSDQMSGVLF